MMKNNIFKVAEYIPIEGEKILLDANVWLYLFSAPSGMANNATKIYSKAFKLMQSSRAKLIVNSLILSEYMNRYCRIEWDALHRVKYPNFKDFRNSNDFLDVAGGASLFAKNILKFCERADDEFLIADMDEVIASFERGESDFNDGMLIDSCLRNGWKFLTHDGDFKSGGIDVITGNNRLIAACA